MGVQRHDQSCHRLRRGFGQQPVAAADSLFLRIARDVQGDALPGVGLLNRLVLRMEAAHAHWLVHPGEPQSITHFYATGECRAGHYQPRALDAKGAIDGKAEAALVGLRALGQRQQVRAQGLNAHSLRRGGSKQRCLRIAVLCQHAMHLGLNLGYPRLVHAIGLGQRHGQRRVAGEL